MYRREHPRFRLHLPISFVRHAQEGTGFGLNLSREGCLIESDSGLMEGDYLELSLHLPDLDPPLKIQSAAVRWVTGRVCGLQFLYMDAEEDNRLDRILTHLLCEGGLGESPVPEASQGDPVDRRKHTRFPVQFQGSFSSAKISGGQGIVRELSQRGCRVASDNCVPSRIILEAQIYLAEGDRPVHIDVAAVRWSEGNEFGLEFLVVEPGTFDRLSRFIDNLARDLVDSSD